MGVFTLPRVMRARVPGIAPGVQITCHHVSSYHTRTPGKCREKERDGRKLNNYARHRHFLLTNRHMRDSAMQKFVRLDLIIADIPTAVKFSILIKIFPDSPF